MLFLLKCNSFIIFCLVFYRFFVMLIFLLVSSGYHGRYRTCFPHLDISILDICL